MPNIPSKHHVWHVMVPVLLILALAAAWWLRKEHEPVGAEGALSMERKTAAMLADENWEHRALADLYAGRPVLLVENGRPLRMELLLDRLYSRALPVAQRWIPVHAADVSTLLREAARLGDQSGLVLRPARVSHAPKENPALPRAGDDSAGLVVLTGKWLLQYRDRAAALAALDAAGFDLVSEPDYARGQLIVTARAGGAEGGLKAAAALHGHTAIVSASPLLLRQKHKHAEPNDPLFFRQWHLKAAAANASKPGADIQVLPVWSAGGTGQGVRIAIVDDGLDMLHPDLLPNLDSQDNHWDWNDTPQDNDPTGKFLNEDFHGTAVAGLAAARGGNSLGVSGVAPQATLVGFRLISLPTDDSDDAEAMLRGNDVIQIKNNSWGAAPTILHPEFFPELGWSGPLTVAARRTAALEGRGGLGTLSVWAAGNDRDRGDQGNKDSYPNSIYGIAVGVLTQTGALANYSEGGSHLTVVAPGATGVVTTDYRGAQGYNTGTKPGELTGSPEMRDYTQTFGGTSASAPVVAGVLALMLEVNPQLGWRDVKEILLRSSTHIFPTQAGWVTRAGGAPPSMPPIKHHELYGGGAVSAQAAVAMAETWENLGPMIEDARDLEPNVIIPDNNAAGVTRTFDFSNVTDLRVEHVTVTLDIAHTFRGDLHITLTSPAGTVSTLAAKTSQDDGLDYDGWTFSSVRHWGESARGLWTLRCQDLARGDTGTLHSAEVRLYGSQVQPAALTLQPMPVIVPEGETAAFTAAGEGGGHVTFQWRKTGAATVLGDGSASFAINSAKLADAGGYTVTATNATGTETSPEAALGVLRRTVAGQSVAEGKTAVLKTAAAGPGLSLRWFRDGTPLNDDGRVTGSGSATLTIKNTAAGDIGAYTCRASFDPPGTVELHTLSAQLDVRLKPVVQPPALVPAIVSGAAALQFTAAHGATRFSIKKTPKGMKFSTATGMLSGTPDLPDTHEIIITAFNASGASQPLTFLWQVEPLPDGTPGAYHGLVDGGTELTGGLGGRFTATLTPTGAFSGNLTLGAESLRFSDRLKALPSGAAPPEATVIIKRAGGRPPVTLAFEVQDGIITGSLDDGEKPPAGFTARRHDWNPALQTVLSGEHTAYFKPDPAFAEDPASPQGSGHIAGTLSAKGLIAWTGRLGDGQTLTCSTPHLLGGRLAFHALVAKKSGSAQGWLILDDTNAGLSGTPEHRRAGLPTLMLGAHGGRYTPVSHLFNFLSAPAGDGNAEAVFAENNVTELFRQPLTLQAPSTLRVFGDNPNRLSLQVNARRGTFTGSFTLPGSPARRAAITGAFVRLPGADPGQGHGYYLLPGPDGLISGGAHLIVPD